MEQNVKEKICHLGFLSASLLLGSTWQEKVSSIRSQMQKHHKAPTALLLSALDETACEYRFSDTCRHLGPPNPQASLTLQDRTPPPITRYPLALRAPRPCPVGTKMEREQDIMSAE